MALPPNRVPVDELDGAERDSCTWFGSQRPCDVPLIPARVFLTQHTDNTGDPPGHVRERQPVAFRPHLQRPARIASRRAVTAEPGEDVYEQRPIRRVGEQPLCPVGVDDPLRPLRQLEILAPMAVHFSQHRCGGTCGVQVQRSFLRRPMAVVVREQTAGR